MKRFTYIVSIVIVCSIMVVYMLSLLVRNAEVQTAAVRWVAAELSDALGAEIDVSHVEYRFFNRLHFSDVYVSDQQGDTLAYIREADIQVRLQELLHSKLSIKNITLEDPYVNLHDDNHAFLVRAFYDPDRQLPDSLPIGIEANAIRIVRLRARIDTLLLTDANTYISIGCINNRTIDATIHQLEGRIVDQRSAGSDRERTLFHLQAFEAELRKQDSIIAIPHIYVRLPHSQLKGDGLHISKNDFGIELHDTYISGRDLGLFIPQVQHADGKIGITASLSGNRDSVLLNELSMSYKGQHVFKGTAIAYDWQDFDSLQLHAECQDFLVRASILQDFLADLLDAPYQLPEAVFRLGTMHYQGALDGRLRNMILHGSFRTALGVISTNGNAQTNAHFDELHFLGTIGTKHFQLGKLLGNSDLGTLSANIQANGHLAQSHPLHGTFQGAVRNITYKGYTYRDITLDGLFGDSNYEGKVVSLDPNICFALEGLVDLNENAPNINIALDLQHLRLDSLHLTDKLTDSDLSLKTYINFSGTHIDHINGYVVIDSLLFANAGDTVQMRQLKIMAESDSEDQTFHSMKLQSDYAVGRFSGHFSYTELGTTSMKIAQHYLPHLFSASKREQLQRLSSTTQASFYLYAHDLDKVFSVLPTSISQNGSLTIKGMVDEPQHKVALSAVVPSLSIGAEEISDIILSIDNRDDRLNIRAAAHVDLPDTMGIGNANVLLNTMAYNDSVLLSLNIENDTEETYGGQIGALATFNEYAGKPVISVHVLPSELYIADATWRMDAASLAYTVADTALTVEHLWMGNEDKHIYVDGVASTHTDDSLYVRLKNIDLNRILSLTALPPRTLTAQGQVTGIAVLYGILSSLQLNADLHVADAGLNGAPIGDVDAQAAFDNIHKAVSITGEAIDNGRHVANIEGEITPRDERSWSLHIYPDSFNIAFVNHWTKAFMQDLEGRASGHVHVFGRNKLTWVTIEVKPHDASFIIPITGAKYFVYDSIYMDSTSIRFPHHTAYDAEKHSITLDGAVEHENFRNFKYHLSMYAHNAIVLDLPNNAANVFDGKVYGTGDVLLYGDERSMNLLAHAKAQNGSTFNLNLFGMSSAKENSFITFVNHDEPATLTIRHRQPKKKELAIDLDLYVNVDQGTQLQVLFHGNNDDRLRGRGEGDMRVHMHNSDLQLQGKLTLRQGNLTYALGNMVHRDFSITDGSTMTWQGGPSDMDLNVTAKYHVTASLKDLFGSDLSSLQTNRTSVPVNCIIYLRDKITNPIVSFGIELPQSDETVQSQVRSLINSDDMLMREVLYLLVFNRFFTPEYLRSTNTTGLNETYSLLSSTVTGQINSWLSKLTNIVTFGINFRTDGEGADASQEYEAQFSIQPIDRLLINGNVGYRYNDLNNRPVFGDLDVEYIVTPDGKLRIKGYTHTVDKYSLRQANMVEGVGLVVQHDFNWGDAFRASKRRKQEQAARADSIQTK